MNHVLTKNNFTFFDKHYLQVHGTAMGTRMAPSMACLFMGKLEERMLALAPCRPWIWWRYIDDKFFIWTSDEERLTRYIDHMNSFHSTIKFTSEYSTTETHFLDVIIRKEENGLTTDLFVKPTDKHQYLHSTSCHPRHCKTSIAYSQALRLRRICSNDSDFLRHSQVLNTHLVSRGHSSWAVHQAIKKVKSMPIGYPYFLRSPQPETVPIRRFLLLSPIIPLYPPYVRLPVLTTISSTPQITSNVLSGMRSLWLLSDALLAWGTSSSELRSRPLMTVPFLPSSMECLGALLDVLLVRNISWS